MSEREGRGGRGREGEMTGKREWATERERERKRKKKRKRKKIDER